MVKEKLILASLMSTYSCKAAFQPPRPTLLPRSQIAGESGVSHLSAAAVVASHLRSFRLGVVHGTQRGVGCVPLACDLDLIV